METTLQPTATVVDAQSGVSWAAIAAGAAAAAAVSLLLIAFGAGLGLSSISPWSNSGVSASTFETGTGIYLVIIGVMSSAVGGYLAGRLRTRWVGLHSNEVFFRDSAHGFLSWAFATIVSASLLSSATAYLANGAVAGVAAATPQAAQSVNPADIYVDELFRTSAPQQQSGALQPTPAGGTAMAGGAAPAAAASSGPNYAQTRAEVLRIWTYDFRNGSDLSGADRTYIAQLVAARTGMSQADAQKRVDDVVTQAKSAADTARRGAAKLSFWMTAALLFGAFAASLAAVEGGALRDGTWSDRVLTPRTI